MKTKNGIELNLAESEYICNFKGITFYFSSLLYKDKFLKRIKDYIEEETIKINLKYDIKIDLSIILAIALYKKIEKRGYYITKTGESKELKDLYIYVEI